ncbi:hypothetical protein BKA83DRAFT_4227448 [Pisolithus microcarpus]|nr:hypothetical protein BKA83DRAFT_4227448 [Pisolithus microcarpus]
MIHCSRFVSQLRVCLAVLSPLLVLSTSGCKMWNTELTFIHAKGILEALQVERRCQTTRTELGFDIINKRR